MTTHPNISSDAIIFGFEAWEDSLNHPARSDVRKCFAKLLQGSKLMFLPRSRFFDPNHLKTLILWIDDELYIQFKDPFWIHKD
jgi:hypothetical protein